MSLTRQQKVGLFFLGGVILFVVFIEATIGTGVFDRRYPLWAEFRDVQGLVEGAQVRVAGVQAGQVDDVVLTGDRVRVGLSIREGVTIREDAVARLEFQALSGQRYVTIDLGSPELSPLEPGSTIRTVEPAGISEMVGQMQNLATQMTDLATSLNENQDRLFTNVNDLLERNERAITETMEHVNTIAAKLARGEGTLGRLLADDRLYDEAVTTLTLARGALNDVRVVTERLAAGEGTLGRLIHEEELYFDAREALFSLNRSAQNAEVISDRIRLGEGTLGLVLTDDSLYLEAEEAVRSLTRASQGIEDQAPISVLGTLIGTMF